MAYRRIKAAIFDFVLLPGEGFTESDMAERLGMSRTPVREALFRLELEAYVKVAFRSGWSVAPFDFRKLEDLYDLRVVLECSAIDRLCAADPMPDLSELKAVWLVPERDRADRHHRGGPPRRGLPRHAVRAAATPRWRGCTAT